MVEEPLALHLLVGSQSIEGDMCPSPRMRLRTTYPDERGCEGRAPVSWGGVRGIGMLHSVAFCDLKQGWKDEDRGEDRGPHNWAEEVLGAEPGLSLRRGSVQFFSGLLSNLTAFLARNKVRRLIFP